MSGKLVELIIVMSAGGTILAGATAAVAPGNIADLNAELGISPIVYACATQVLAGQTPEELTTLIEATDNIGTPAETDAQKQLAACVQLDPYNFGPTPTPDQELVKRLLDNTPAN